MELKQLNRIGAPCDSYCKLWCREQACLPSSRQKGIKIIVAKMNLLVKKLKLIRIVYLLEVKPTSYNKFIVLHSRQLNNTVVCE